MVVVGFTTIKTIPLMSEIFFNSPVLSLHLWINALIISLVFCDVCGVFLGVGFRFFVFFLSCVLNVACVLSSPLF